MKLLYFIFIGLALLFGCTRSDSQRQDKDSITMSLTVEDIINATTDTALYVSHDTISGI